MNCPKCGQEIDQDEELCPICGAPLRPQEEAETAPVESDKAPQEAPAEENQGETVEETVEAPQGEAQEDPQGDSEADSQESAEDEPQEVTEAPAEEAQEAPMPEKKKKSPFAIVAGVIIVLLAVIIVCLSVALSRANKGGEKEGTSVAEEANIDGDALALTVQNADGETVEEINNRQLSFYFWGEYFYYVNNYGFSFDASQPLSEQTYQEQTDSETGDTTVTTWEDYFMQSAQDSIIQTVALKQEAEEKGFTMPEDYQSEYDSVVDNMASNAASAGFTDEDGNGDVLAYIQDSYGSSATVEDFKQYLYDSYYVSAYSDSIYKGFTYDDTQVEEYYDQHAEELQNYGVEKSDLPNVNVRHILITPETDEDGNTDDAAWAAAEEKAQEVLKEWQDGDATEESFGELANTYSTDTGSNSNGGLYEDVYPGQMVTEFNDWCFDASRKPGDTDIVKTSYGYHVMYFVSFTDEYYYKTVAEQELRYNDYRTYLEDLMTTLTTTLTKDAAVAEPNAVKEIQEQAAQQAAAQQAAAQAAQEQAADSAAEESAVDSAAG